MPAFPTQLDMPIPSIDAALGCDSPFSERSVAPREKSVRWSTDMTATAAARPQLFADELEVRTLLKHAADLREDADDRPQTPATSSDKVRMGRRYSIGSASAKHMQHELSAGTHRRREVDLNASLDLELHRSISKLFDSDDEEDPADAGSNVGAAASAQGDVAASEEDIAGLRKARLLRGYSIGVEGREHVVYDIHASHQLDLHQALYAPKADATKRDPEQPKRVGVQDWLFEVDKSRRAKFCKASTVASAPTPPLSPLPVGTPPREASPIAVDDLSISSSNAS